MNFFFFLQCLIPLTQFCFAGGKILGLRHISVMVVYFGSHTRCSLIQGVKSCYIATVFLSLGEHPFRMLSQ